MKELSRDGVWLVVTLVASLFAVSQYRVARGLEAQLEGIARIDVQMVEQAARQERERLLTMLSLGRGDFIAAGRWLHQHAQSEDGLQRPDGLWVNGEPDFEGIGAWLMDIYLASRLEGLSDSEARRRVTVAIQNTEEWREKHREPAV